MEAMAPLKKAELRLAWIGSPSAESESHQCVWQRESKFSCQKTVLV